MSFRCQLPMSRLRRDSADRTDSGAAAWHCWDLPRGFCLRGPGTWSFRAMLEDAAVSSGSLSCGAGLGHRSNALLRLWSWPGI